jgi:NADH:ubiquinone oxidoreductase subunit F (NADH-binding)/NADH:ubiquinone oxidoreductase subunit E
MMIVQELHKIQHRVGYLPHPELENLAERLGTPYYRIQEVASFFPHFRLTPPAPVEVEVCRDMACALRGSCGLLRDLEARAREFESQEAKKSGNFVAAKSDAPRLFDVKYVSCLGRCDRAPAVRVSTHSKGHAATQNYLGRKADDIWRHAQAGMAGSLPAGDSDINWVPTQLPDWKIDVYSGAPKYLGVRDFIDKAKLHAATPFHPDEHHPRCMVIRMLETAGLLGMGGAGGKAYQKWLDVQNAQGDEKFIVCNGDESEPATFKDREILLRMPHLVVEGMILAALVVGAQKGFVYIRHEYEECIESVRAAIKLAVDSGFCGEHILDSEYSFDLQVFVSPGGYICGEQSALIQAIEDKRAEPRNRPPELQTNGLWDKPTIVNNVETLAWVPAIVLQDEGRNFAASGRPGFKGRRLLSISGDVANPGVYEIANGTPLRELINLAGGMRDGLPLKAMALSGPSGGFTPARVPVKSLPADFVKTRLPPGTEFFDLLDFELDIDNSRKSRLMFGAGLVAYAADANLVEQSRVSHEFYHKESCGKCVPCRIGSRKFFEYTEDLEARRWRAAELAQRTSLLKELSIAMDQASICGLGKVAHVPLITLLKYFPDEVAPYLI